MSELSREAEGKAQVLVRLAGYLTARGNGHSHESACVYALKREKAVRKALGYTYP